MSDLSPQAQAVLDAFVNAACGSTYEMQHGIAAALRAAADQVAPSKYKSFTGYAEWDHGMEARTDAIRESLLALADKLDGNHPEKPDSSIDGNLKAELTSYQSVPTSLVPMEYVDLESGARIVCEPSEEGSGACWNVLNFSGIHSFTEFPTVDAAWQAMQRVKEAQG